MKVSGGLIGITLNASARTRFFLIGPELARLSEEAQTMVGVKVKTPTLHHTISTTYHAREEANVSSLTNILRNFTNPFDVDGHISCCS